MQGIPEALQLPVIIQRRGPLAPEPEAAQKIDFGPGGIGGERWVLEECEETRLVRARVVGLSFNELKFLRTPGGEAVVQHNVQPEGREIDVPRIYQRVQEGNAVRA